MKKLFSSKVLGPSLLSFLILGVFFLLAVVSGLPEFMHYDMKYLGNGIYEEMDYTDYEHYEYTKTTGSRDNKGRWQGPVRIYYSSEHDFGSNEEVTMVDGKRHGTSKETYYGFTGDPHVITKCYNMGVEVPCKKSTASGQNGISAYQILGEKYSWYFFSQICFGYDSTYVKSYLDTLETLLYANEFEDDEFDDYYSDVQDSLSNTHYDSIIVLQMSLFIFQGLSEMKNAECRLAVIDHYRSDGTPTFDIITETYPNYLQTMVGSGVEEADFEQFCQDLDDSLATYGPLDPEDPYYVDSIDSYYMQALYSIMDMKKSALSAESRLLSDGDMKILDINGIRRLALLYATGLKSTASPESSSDVAQFVALDMSNLFMTGDIIRRVVLESYQSRKGIVSMPVVTTEFAGNTSATSVDLTGNVIGDGGGEVTERGIAWGDIFNPAMTDQTVASGTGTGSFAITLNGLTEGKTYYARSYATNSAGTAYGNCVEFVARVPSGTRDISAKEIDLKIYPNPASSGAEIGFDLASPGKVTVSIINTGGQQVLYRDLGRLPQGENKYQLDLSGLPAGLYTCRLTCDDRTEVCKLEVVR